MYVTPFLFLIWTHVSARPFHPLWHLIFIYDLCVYGILLNVIARYEKEKRDTLFIYIYIYMYLLLRSVFFFLLVILNDVGLCMEKSESLRGLTLMIFQAMQISWYLYSRGFFFSLYNFFIFNTLKTILFDNHIRQIQSCYILYHII